MLALANAGHPPPPPSAPPGITFNSTQGDMMVLQQAPAKACVYGMLGAGGTGADVEIASTSSGGSDAAVFIPYQVAAQVTADGAWKACLQPHKAGGDFTITAKCTGCSNTTAAVLRHVTFGDVWYALPLASHPRLHAA